jgi:hypothetical protein
MPAIALAAMRRITPIVGATGTEIHCSLLGQRRLIGQSTKENWTNASNKLRGAVVSRSVTLQTRHQGWLHLVPALLVCAVVGSGLRSFVAGIGRSHLRGAAGSLATTAEPPDDRTDDPQARDAVDVSGRPGRAPAAVLLAVHVSTARPVAVPRRLVRPQKIPALSADADPPY